MPRASTAATGLTVPALIVLLRFKPAVVRCRWHMKNTSFDPQTALLDWYALNQRDLPWRREPTPYRVLLSELMLQQTQVDRVIPFFDRFVDRFPTITALAAAPRAAVIEAWAGLGYNRRAVYLHQLASAVREHHGGQIPDDYQQLRKLPGIGEYTAGAILSIGFDHDVAALDTNATRVIERYAFGRVASPRELRERASQLIPPGRGREWNQALMDLASSLCSARMPRCLLCPLQPGCRGTGALVARPRKPEKIPFHQSARYYRGRMLAALLELGAEQRVGISEIARSLAVRGVAEPAVGWTVIGEGLARDGLASIEGSKDEPRIGLPT